MPTFVSAGVYPIEKDESLYAPGTSPTIVGLLGTATKGPTNERVLITDVGQLVEIFGIPRTKDYGLHAAVEALLETRLLYYVRIAGGSASQGSLTVADQGSAATAPSVTSSSVEPFNFEPGDTLIVTGSGGLTSGTITLTATSAGQRNGNTGTVNMTANGGLPSILAITVDGNAQAITFTTDDFATDSAATGDELAAALNARLIGGRAVFDSSSLGLQVFSDTRGTDSTVTIGVPASGNNANSNLVLNTAVASTGNVGNIDRVETSELVGLINGTSAEFDASVAIGGALKISRDTTGSSSTIQVSSSSTVVGVAPRLNISTTSVAGTNNGLATNTITFKAKTSGSHSSSIQLVVSASLALPGTSKIVVKYRGATVETYDKLWKGSGVAPTGSYPLVETINSGSSDGQFPSSDYITIVDVSASAGIPTPTTYTLPAGNNGDDWTASTVVGTQAGSVKSGLQLFADPEEVGVNVLATPGISYAGVITAATTICETRGDCIYIGDAPRALATKTKLEADEVVRWHNGDPTLTVIVDQENRTEVNTTQFNSVGGYSALYYPWGTIQNAYATQLSEERITVPPSGSVIRTFAYTDKVSDPWFAPAGLARTRSSYLDLQLKLNQGDRDLLQLQGNNINPLVVFTGSGMAIWGQKTTQKQPTALDRINVRRLLNQAKVIVARSVLFLTFEPNDPVMWRRFINLVSPVFEDIKARRGIFQFLVVADSTTNTPLVIDQNTFVGKIFLQPTKAAEKIVVPFILTPTGASFEDFAQA